MGLLRGKFEANGELLMDLWAKMTRLPGGKLVFSRLAGRLAPYTGTIKAYVEDLEPGYARLSMNDRPGLRNHLKSIHAIALANFVEETTGMAMVSQFPSGMRGIVTHIEVDYLKKARGKLIAECRAPAVDESVTAEYTVETQVMDGNGDIVAVGRARWNVGAVREV